MMIVYFILFAILLLLSANKKKVVLGNKYYNEYDSFLFVSWMLLSLLEGVRAFNIGTDTRGYANSFILQDYMYETYEILSKGFVDFVHLFTANATIYLLLAAFITNGVIIIAIKRMSEDKPYSVFLFIALLFYFTSYNG